MRVVSNTSPLSNLAIVDQLELLREQLGRILIPSAVRLELDRLSHPAARARLEAAFRDGWVKVVPLTAPPPEEIASTLDAGEAEALALALAGEVQASLILLDETAARRKADQLRMPHVGILGILRHAKRSGRIRSLADEIRRLRAEARFFVNPDLEKRLLISVGETWAGA